MPIRAIVHQYEGTPPSKLGMLVFAVLNLSAAAPIVASIPAMPIRSAAHLTAGFERTPPILDSKAPASTREALFADDEPLRLLREAPGPSTSRTVVEPCGGVLRLACEARSLDDARSVAHTED